MSQRRHTIGVLVFSPDDRRLLAGFLKQQGYQICAPAPARARAWIFEGTDLVILDEVAAVGETGRSILALKEHPDSPYLPALVAARPGRTGPAHWIRMGFDDVVRMPFRRGEIAAQVRMFLRLRDQYERLTLKSRSLAENRLRCLSSRLLAALEDEKKWIAQELHDGIGQTLAAIKYGLEKKLTRMEKGAAPPGFALEDILDIVQSSMEEVRRIMMGLRPSMLDRLGILASVNWLCREFQKVYAGIRIDHRILVEEVDVPPPLKLVIYRILQEALNNIARHSRASAVRLSLEKRNGSLEMAIEDNGVGFDPASFPPSECGVPGLGLAGMKHRAELSGGSFLVKTGHGAGTVIRASWPA